LSPTAQDKGASNENRSPSGFRVIHIERLRPFRFRRRSWTVFYILLAVHAGHALKLRTDTAVAVAPSEGGGSVGDVALRPNR